MLWGPAPEGKALGRGLLLAEGAAVTVLVLAVSERSEETQVRGSQGASRAAPGKSGLHARGEGERVLALESRASVESCGCGLGPSPVRLG